MVQVPGHVTTLTDISSSPYSIEGIMKGGGGTGGSLLI